VTSGSTSFSNFSPDLLTTDCVFFSNCVSVLFMVLTSGVFRIGKWGAWRARRARAYNESLETEHPAGSRGRAPGRWSGGRSPLEAETLFVFERLMESANSPIFLKCGNR